jgi:hypothetical protein
MLLVAGNVATCTGDQGHDGEAIAFDGNRNAVGFVGSQVVFYAWHSATAGEPSIVLSHNLTIVHNTIRAADGTDGAIGTRVSAGATSDPWSLSTIHLFRNTILDVPVGIAISGNSAYPQTWRSVLQGNTFVNVPTPVVDNGQETTFLP